MTDAEKALDALNKLTNPHIFLVQIQKKELAETISKALQRVDKVQGLVALMKEAQGYLESDHRGQTGLDLTKTGLLGRVDKALAAFGADDLGVT